MSSWADLLWRCPIDDELGPMADALQQLREARGQVESGRSRLVRVDRGRRALAYEGWRNKSIGETLDLCSRIHGHLVVDRSTLVVDSAQYKLQWARENRDKARENSKVQWRKTDAAMRATYQVCRAAYGTAYPGEAVPGYDTWRRQFRAQWISDQARCLDAMRTWKLSSERGLRISLTPARVAA